MLSYVPVAATLFVIAASISQVEGQNQVHRPMTRIIQGENTTIEEHPHQVSLRVRVKTRVYFICGGSIISRYHVLTAAHCLDQISASQLSIQAGSTYKYSGGKVYKVKLTIIHEDYRVNRKNIPEQDIGLIRVTEPFTYDPATRPIELFRSGEKAKADENAVITGWGRTERGFTNVLQKVNVPIVDENTCNDVYKFWGGLPEGQICAGYQKGACFGDSGGALTVKGRQAGIASWVGGGCGNPKYPDVYTEVAHYYEWIQNKIRQL